MNPDPNILSFLNDLSKHSGFLASLAVFIGEYLQYFLGAFFLFLLFWPKKDRLKNRTMVLLALISAVIARLMVKPAILLFHTRPRPYSVLPSARQLIEMTPKEALQAFPSGHAIIFFAVAMSATFFNRALGAILFGVALLVGVSRIIAGVHWPSDIVAGALLGVLVACCVQLVYFKQKNRIEKFILLFDKL